ncbi:MAG: hypothetical protein J6W81_09930 [Lentisphaeria bacterium]|nr:hypothetical protein [Lentisphaeria bacterium]
MTGEQTAQQAAIKAAAENPWRARYAWFWYNSAEIWQFTQADMDAKVKKYADAGFTHLITFSCTHFRWSFRPWWKEINECLRKIVVSAHKYGLKVIEHHSSNLTKFPKNDPDGMPLKRLLNTLHTRCSKLEDWPGLIDHLLDETTEEEQWCQIDAVTGEKCFTHYFGHSKCPNNPDYIKGYLKYLESVYATGVDGIMTDDMYAYPNMILHEKGKIRMKQPSCGCAHCRKLFRETYGYDMPAPDKWDAWYGNMDDPTFIDFLKFRRMTYMGFHKKVAEHYKSLGLKLIRPNYDAVAFRHDHEGGVAAMVPEMDVYFQECMFSCAIRYSWPLFLFEQKMRAEYARLRNIPHMMMFYADRPDTLNFTFGLCRIAGAMYTNTPEGENNTDETPLRNFENKYHKFIFGAQEQPVAGFLNSEKNRFFSAGFFDNRTSFWMQATIFRNIPAVFLNMREPENWKTPVLIANEVRLLSAEEITLLKKYAENGGTLVLTGICGEQDENSAFRTPEQINALWGIDLYDETYADSYKIFPLGKGKICRVGYHFGYPGSKEENKLRFVYDERRRKKNYVSPKQEMLATPISRGAGLKTQTKPAADYNLYSRNSLYFDRIATLITELAGEKLTYKTELPDLILTAPYYSEKENALVIHMVNAMDTLPKSMDEVISHDHPVPFTKWTGKDGVISILLPEKVSGKNIIFTDLTGKITTLSGSITENARLNVIIPAGLLHDYGMIVIR